MGEKTSRDRIRAAMKRTIADRIPISLILGPFRAKVLGCSLQDYWGDGKKLAEATVTCQTLFQLDSLDVTWDIVMEAETVGAELEFHPDSVPQVKRHVLAEKRGLSALKLPDPEGSGRYPQYLEACRIVAGTLQNEALSGTVTGPWTMATGLRGAQELIFDTVDDPAFVDELLKFTTAVTKILGSKIIATGLSLTMGEAASSCSLISPALYRRFIKPRHQEIVRFFREQKSSLAMHVCGYIDPIMEDLIDLGIVALSLDSPSSLQRMVEVSGKKIVAIGNVSPALFVRGTKEEIVKAVKGCIQIAARGGAYFLSSGCELPFDATLERVQFFLEAAKDFGRAEVIQSL